MKETVQRIRRALAGISRMPGSEKALHEDIARRLEAAGMEHVREAATGTGPVDFALGALAMEVKMGGGANEIARQVIRYLQEPRFSALVLVTAKAVALPIASVETSEGEKPVYVIELWRNFV